MSTQTHNVQGMTCGHCERAVTQAVQQIDPAATVRIDRAQNRVDGVFVRVFDHAPKCLLQRPPPGGGGLRAEAG